MSEEQPSTEFKKRAVAKIRKISEISKDDTRVSVVGTVTDVDEKNFTFSLDDSSKKLSVILLDEALIHKVKTGRIMRIIGLVISNDSGIELKGEIVQDFSGLNIEYYNKFLSMQSMN